LQVIHISGVSDLLLAAAEDDMGSSAAASVRASANLAIEALLATLDALAATRCVVVLESVSPLPPQFRRPRRVVAALTTPPLASDVRGRIARQQTVSAFAPHLTSEALEALAGQVEAFATACTPGFTGSDLNSAVLAAADGQATDAATAFASIVAAIQGTSPSLISGAAFAVAAPELPEVPLAVLAATATGPIRKLVQSIVWPLTEPERFTRLGTSPPAGILLYGAPGTGKSAAVRAIAAAMAREPSAFHFACPPTPERFCSPSAVWYVVPGPALFSAYLGETERRLRALYANARQSAPSVVVLDGIDVIVGRRDLAGGGGRGSDVEKRVLTALLTELDGVDAFAGVITVCVTSRPDSLDEALLRPGRMDVAIHMPLPDAPAKEAAARFHLRPAVPAEAWESDDAPITLTNSTSPFIPTGGKSQLAQTLHQLCAFCGDRSFADMAGIAQHAKTAAAAAEVVEGPGAADWPRLLAAAFAESRPSVLPEHTDAIVRFQKG
jgi:transitional endoplasmic reticulum ATPase